MINCYGVNCTGWELMHPLANINMLGYVPLFLMQSDQRRASEQINERYVYGGWHPSPGMPWSWDAKTYDLRFPGDPMFRPIAKYVLRDEVILLYPSAITLIGQQDGTFEVSRLD